jgi:glycosyltransferase involved in cell wall biosynthesis
VTDQPAAGAPLRISVVVVNWNGGDMVQDCLRSLVADGDPSGTGGVEILLVDNASTDGSPDRALAAFPGVRLVRPEGRPRRCGHRRSDRPGAPGRALPSGGTR